MKAPVDPARLANAIIATGSTLLREAGRLFKPHGVTAVQFNVLHLLSDVPGGLRPSELTAALVVDASSTTYVMDRMETLGWLKRVDDKADRRAWRVVLTPAGQKRHAALAPLYFAALGEMLRRLRRTDVARVVAALEGIPAAAHAAVDAALAKPGTPTRRGVKS